MKDDWDSLARINAPYYIFTAPEFADPQTFDANKFFESGRRDVDDILASLSFVPNPRGVVLDIGCGLGRLTRRLDELFLKAVGVDVSAEMIARAKSLIPTVDFRVVDGVDLRAFANGTFDVVFSFIVFQHLPNITLLFSYLKEISRVLKPNGSVLFQASTSVFPAFKRMYWNWQRSKQDDPNRDRRSMRGCTATAGAIERHGARYGLMTDIVLFQGTPWTYFRMSKRDPGSILAGQRSAQDARPELEILRGSCSTATCNS